MFKLFDVIRRAATRHEAISRVAREAVEDFAADGCCLLELRTTPKVRRRKQAAAGLWLGGSRVPLDLGLYRKRATLKRVLPQPICPRAPRAPRRTCQSME